jgi:hypothetical protein
MKILEQNMSVPSMENTAISHICKFLLLFFNFRYLEYTIRYVAPSVIAVTSTPVIEISPFA